MGNFFLLMMWKIKNKIPHIFKTEQHVSKRRSEQQRLPPFLLRKGLHGFPYKLVKVLVSTKLENKSISMIFLAEVRMEGGTVCQLGSNVRTMSSLRGKAPTLTDRSLKPLMHKHEK